MRQKDDRRINEDRYQGKLKRYPDLAGNCLASNISVGLTSQVSRTKPGRRELPPPEEWSLTTIKAMPEEKATDKPLR